MKKEPCPFCGARGKDLDVFEIDAPACKFVECQNCGALGPQSVVIDGELYETMTKALAIQAWNRRAKK